MRLFRSGARAGLTVVAIGCAVVFTVALMGNWRSHSSDAQPPPELVAEGFLVRPETFFGAVLVTGAALACFLLARRRRSSKSDVHVS
jgi:hypothetical protein